MRRTNSDSTIMLALLGVGAVGLGIFAWMTRPQNPTPTSNATAPAVTPSGANNPSQDPAGDSLDFLNGGY